MTGARAEKLLKKVKQELKNLEWRGNIIIFAMTNLTTRVERQRTRVGLFLYEYTTMANYTKQALDTPDLLAMLKQRGLVVIEDNTALKTLSFISYFRLACYFRPLEADKQTHTFYNGTTLDFVAELKTLFAKYPTINLSAI